LVPAVLHARRARHLPPAPAPFARTAVSWRWLHFLVPAAVTTELVLRPLGPPEAWDELMYHLPHARDWVSTGRLQVNEWLRYPLFPYNFNLLFAGGLVFGNDIFAHMAHAFAGALVIAGMYGLAARHFGHAVAAIAILLFVSLTKTEFGNAYVDLGLTAFLFFSAGCTLLWYESGRFRLVCLAAFLLGVAAGIKYQALVFAPFLVVAILLRERRIRRLAVLAVLFALPCAYWYIRNFLVSGDPVHPLGGAVFGYWGWDQRDMEYQVADIRRVYGWPNLLVWPAAGAVALWTLWGKLAFRSIFLFSVYAFAAWMLTSHYPRYLLPAYPFLCILSALVVTHGVQSAVVAPLSRRSNDSSPAWWKAGQIFLAIALGLVFLASLGSAARKWQTIQPNAVARAAYLREKIQSYEVAEFLRSRPGYRLVQIGLESDLYYLPPGTIGDVFGPGRYRDLIALPPQQLAARVRSFGANALLLPTTGEAAEISNRSGFGEAFSLLVETAGARLYAVK